MKRDKNRCPFGTMVGAVAFLALALLLAAGPVRAEDDSPTYRVVVFAPQGPHYFEGHPYAALYKADLEKQWPGRQVELRYFPREIADDPPAVSRTLVDLAANPRIRGLVLGEAPVGCLDGVARLRAQRPDIFVIAIDPHEKMERMAKVATLTLALNHSARAFIYPTMAHRMGARTLVFFSFPQHMSLPNFGQQYRVLRQATQDMNMILVSDLTGPPSTGSAANAMAIEQYLEKAVRGYLEQYGPNTAFVSTSLTYSDALVPIVLREGGAILPAVQPSPLLGYPEALDLVEEARALFGQWRKLQGVIDEKIMALRPQAEFAAWTYPYPHTVMLAMTELTVKAIEEQSDLYKQENIHQALSKYSPGIKWLVTTQMDYLNDRLVPQALLLIQDTYWFGHGFQGFTHLNIPAKYYRIR